jgi:hypothetical protein
MSHAAMRVIAQISAAADIPYNEAYQVVVDAAYKHPISVEDLAHAILCALNLGVPWPGVVDIITDLVYVGIPPAYMCFNQEVFR